LAHLSVGNEAVASEGLDWIACTAPLRVLLLKLFVFNEKRELRKQQEANEVAALPGSTG
jgi:hypothetical protein